MWASRLERVGGNETLDDDVRLIAATNMNLPIEVAKGRFRPDPFFGGWRAAEMLLPDGEAGRVPWEG